MIFTKIKTLLTILFTFFNFLNINSQTIAYAEKLNSQEYFNRIYNIRMENPAEDLYDLNWNHSHVHVYSQLDAPKSYNIRLTRFSMPLKNNIIVTSKVGYRKRFGRNHNGVDLVGHIGDTIYACFDGKIRMVDYQPKGYGRVVVIRHYNGLETIYGHMSKPFVSENQYIHHGDPIGLVGNTGRSTGPHLHIETRFCGKMIDPEKIFDFKMLDIKDDWYYWRE
jgi:murein DD-endopeptidase MepM/ murein hydrolase activator NlpD